MKELEREAETAQELGMHWLAGVKQFHRIIVTESLELEETFKGLLV